MSEINDLNVTDASNTARFPEGMARAALNNAARALEGILARWHKDTNASIAAGGTGDAITVSANQTISAYYDGLVIAFNATAANTTATTLNVDSVGAKKVFKHFNSELVANDIKSGQKVIVIYDSDGDSSAGAWQMVSQLGNLPSSGLVATSLTLTAGAGLTGGGDLSSNRSFAVGAGTGITVNADDVAVTVASQNEMEAKTSGKIPDAAILHHHPLVPKAWGRITYDGSGVPSLTSSGTSSGTLSVADTATGRVTVTLGFTMSASSYAPVACFFGPETTDRQFCSVASIGTTTFEIQFTSTGGSLADPSNGNGATFVVFGDI